MERSILEILAFALLSALSLALFWLRMRRVLQRILGSKPDQGLPPRHFIPRLARLFWEVLCQAKVIRERPIPGLSHALVFWGFLAFAIVTVNHIALGFGFRLFHISSGWFGPLYSAAAFLFSLAVAAGITALAVRRFLVRPKWLGEKLSWESGLIAFLIFFLMATYAAEYLLHPDPASSAGLALWWAHSAALLIFLPLVPHTKHLHLMLSPFTIFHTRPGFSTIPPLIGEDDFGLDTGRDITRIAALQAYTCVECGRCQQHCPAHATGKLLNPKEIALGFRGFLEENGAASEKPLLGVHLSSEAVFQCTTCGACEYQCPVGVQHLPLIVGLRRGAVNTGKWEDDHGGELFVRLERNGNPLGMAAYERDKFIKSAGLPLFDGSQDYCLWLGCMGSYDPQGRETVLALVRVLTHLQISFGVLKKEKCTGDAARRLGNDLAFMELGQFNIAEMERSGVKKLLSICPHCVRTIGEDWKELGASYEIEHHSELLARHSAQLGLDGASEAQQNGKVVYHDPCYLGRYRNVYDEPRRVAASAGPLVEAELSRERSFCCGAGGGLVFLGEEKGNRVSHERARQLLDTGAKTLAAACPFCHTMFRDALSELAPDAGPKLVDIAQIAAAHLSTVPPEVTATE